MVNGETPMILQPIDFVVYPWLLIAVLSAA
jgi:hypothetical protein